MKKKKNLNNKKVCVDVISQNNRNKFNIYMLLKTVSYLSNINIS